MILVGFYFMASVVKQASSASSVSPVVEKRPKTGQARTVIDVGWGWQRYAPY